MTLFKKGEDYMIAERVKSNDSFKKIDVLANGTNSRPRQKTIDAFIMFKKNRRRYKTIKQASNETGMATRQVARAINVLKFGSKQTIQNIIDGEITLVHADKFIRDVIKKLKIKEESKKKIEEENLNLVQDETNGQQVPLEFYTAKRDFWQQLQIAKNNGFKYVDHQSLVNDLENMIALVSREE